MPQTHKKSKSIDGSKTHQPVIMQIIPELGPGGAEQGCLDVAKGIIEAGGKAIVVSHGGSRVPELSRHGAVHINLPVHSKNPLTIWRNIGRLKKLIKKYNVDIVHVRSRAPAWSAYYACKKANVSYMTTCHASYNINDNDWKRRYNEMMTKGERVIAVSDHVATYLKDNYQMNTSNIRVVHRGVDLNRYGIDKVIPAQIIEVATQWNLPEDARIILLPGRVSRIKGHHVLIEAMSLLEEENVYCVLLGSNQGRDEYTAELSETIQKYNLGERIRIIDHCKEMPAAYMLSNIVVCPSTKPEGFGRIPIEAQIMGKPIIAANHGGVMETIIDGQTGWLVPPNDAHALKEAIKHVLSLTEDEKNILANNAINHVLHHFTNDQMVDKTLDVYAELMQR